MGSEMCIRDRANLVCASPVGRSAAQQSERNTGEVTAAYAIGTPWGCTRAPSAPQTQSGARPQAEALSSTPSASGSRSAWAAAPHLQVLQVASWASGRPAGRSQCAPVNPAGPRRSLQVPALGSEQPGPRHSVSRKCGRPGVHPEAVWELTAQLAPVALSLGSSPEASGTSPQISPPPDPDQPGQQHHISRSCKRQEGLPGGQRGEVGVLQ